MFSVDKDSGEMWLYDEIGPAWWGLIDEGAVKQGLETIGNKTAHVHINSPGGSVDVGVAIYNLLKSHKGGVVTYCDSLAASMGSYVFMAGDQRLIASNGMVMIHDPWSVCIGNAAQMRKEADIIDKYRDRMVPDYAAKSGKTADEIRQIMAEETWYTAQECIDAGFATAIDDSGEDVEPVVAGLRHIASKVPQSLVGRESKAGDKTRFPRRAAAIAASQYMTVEEAKKKLASIR